MEHASFQQLARTVPIVGPMKKRLSALELVVPKHRNPEAVITPDALRWAATVDCDPRTTANALATGKLPRGRLGIRMRKAAETIGIEIPNASEVA